MADTSLVFSVLVKDLASKTLGKIGGAAHLAVAAAASTAGVFAKSAISAASDLSETQSKVSTIFGSSASQVMAFAAKADRALGQSQQEALEGAATFATYGKQAGLSGSNLVGFSTKLNTLASDMASFSNTSPQEAIEAIGAALRGESDPIEKYGVLLNESVIQQRALHMGLIKTTSQALTPQQRVMAAQAEIFAQTSDAQGDFSRTSNGLANRQRIMAAEWENSKAKLGQGLLPVMLKFASTLQSTIDFVSRNRSTIVPLVAVLGTLAGIVYGLVTATKIWTAVQVAFNLVMAMNPVVLITLAVIALIAVIVLIATKTTWFQTIWHAVWGAMKVAAEAVWKALKVAAMAVFDFLKAIVLGYWHFYSGIFIKVGQAAMAAWRILKDGATAAFKWVSDKVSAFIGFFQKLPGRIGAAAKGMFDGIKNAFRSAINWLIGKWNGLSFTIPSINTHIPGIGRVGGFSLSTPNIPLLATGGDVLRTGLAVIHQGERVMPAAQARRLPAGGGPTVIEIRSDGGRMGELLLQVLREAIRVRGGDVQVVLGRG